MARQPEVFARSLEPEEAERPVRITRRTRDRIRLRRAAFTALRYFTLDSSDYPNHAAQQAAIAGYIRWHNKHAGPKTNFAVDSKIRKPTTYPTLLDEAPAFLAEMWSLTGEGVVADDPVVVELVGLPAVTRDERVPCGEFQPEEVEDATGDTVDIGGEVFIVHGARLNAERVEPVSPGVVVFFDGLDEVVDLLEVEAGLVVGQGSVAVLPEASLFSARP